MPVERIEHNYLERCISATNFYVETYNKNMQREIANGVCLPLGKGFKEDRFKSMTGQIWLESYEGVIRRSQVEIISKVLGEYYEGMVSQANQGGIANESNAG